MKSQNLHPTTPDCEIRSTRIVPFPIDSVYEAWTNPDLLKQWWGPNGFTNTFHEHDLRVGGQWRFTMHGPERGNYENHCEFTHIDPPTLIAWKRHSMPLFRVVATFKAITPNQTQIVLRQVFDTAKECNKIKPFAVDKNEENFDRLEEILRRNP